jgi:hypothetical protein
MILETFTPGEGKSLYMVTLGPTVAVIEAPERNEIMMKIKP